MKSVRFLAAFVLALGLAASPSAGDPQPATQAQNSTTAAPGTPINETPAAQSGAVTAPAIPDPAAGLVDIPENQAELEAARAGQLKLIQPEGQAPAAAVDAARAARRAAFDAVVEDQDAKVRALADRLSAAKGDEAVAIQKEIEHVKLATGRNLLELQLDFATRDGDQPRIDRLRAALAEWDAPAPVGTPVERPVPSIQGR